MKKLFLVLGIILLIALIFILSILFVLNKVKIDQESTFTPFLKDVVPKLMVWDPLRYEEYMTVEGYAELNSSQWVLLLSKLSSLFESYESIGNLDLVNYGITKKNLKEAITYAIYKADVFFEDEKLNLIIEVHKVSDDLKVHSIQFHSDLLFE